MRSMQICAYVLTCSALGAEFQVYYCVAVLNSLQGDIVRMTGTREFVV